MEASEKGWKTADHGGGRLKSRYDESGNELGVEWFLWDPLHSSSTTDYNCPRKVINGPHIPRRAPFFIPSPQSPGQSPLYPTFFFSFSPTMLSRRQIQTWCSSVVSRLSMETWKSTENSPLHSTLVSLSPESRPSSSSSALSTV